MGASNLKLYLWEEVLTDWTHGVMFAVAASEAEAKRLIIETDPNSRTVKEELERVKPQVIEGPFGFTLWGGG